MSETNLDFETSFIPYFSYLEDFLKEFFDALPPLHIFSSKFSFEAPSFPKSEEKKLKYNS